MILEVCCGNEESVDAAVAGGAPRIELCSHLELDGLTPEWETLRTVRERYPGLVIHVLIRPRAGDFHYSAAEAAQMVADARTALSLGVDGIVVGALTPEGDPDIEILRQFQAPSLTFHRAFDVCRAPLEAMEAIIGLGWQRILTSGQAPSALEGAGLIRQLQEKAAGRIILLPGGGVTPENARRILELTGCSELHASASETGHDGRKVTSARKVEGIINAV